MKQMKSLNKIKERKRERENEGWRRRKKQQKNKYKTVNKVEMKYTNKKHYIKWKEIKATHTKNII